MKIIISSIAALTFTFALTFNLNLSNIDPDPDPSLDTPPDVHYEAGMSCIDCHGSADLHNMRWDLKLIVHQPQNAQFIDGLESFLSTHTEEEAANKLVDYQSVIDIVTSQ